MKKIISLVLSFIFVLALIPFTVFANEDTDEEITNVAPLGMAYSSSEKNSLWTPPKSINDDKYDWHGWECLYPNVSADQDTSAGFNGEYCGIKFLNRKYYEIHEINMCIGLHSLCGHQNARYTIEFLVEGAWVKVAEVKDEQAVDIVKSDNGKGNIEYYESYLDAMENDTSNYHIRANIKIALDKPVTTNNVRITVSDYARNYMGGDVLIFPYIYEVELMGKEGEAPEIDLPEGAVISTNIAYNSLVEASSSEELAYPYLAIDGKGKTAWSPETTSAGESLTLNFPKEYTVDKVVLNFGEYLNGSSYENHSFSIEALIGGKWEKVANGNSLDEKNETLVTEYAIEPVKTTSVRIVFDKDSDEVPCVYEFEAHISGEKTYYLENRITNTQIMSASKGNLAVTGTAYASRNFLPYSETYYINDGGIADTSYVWFSGTLEIPVYCGVKLDRKYSVDKVAVYVQAPKKEGSDIMHFDIQALVDGEYVTVAKGKSYDPDTKYITVYEFAPVLTDDIRVVYTRGNGTIPNMRELEIYSGDMVHSMFEGVPPMAEPPSAKSNDASAEQMSVTFEADTLKLSAKSASYVSESTSSDNYNFKKAIVIVSCVAAMCVSGVVMVLVFRKNKKGS